MARVTGPAQRCLRALGLFRFDLAECAVERGCFRYRQFSGHVLERSYLLGGTHALGRGPSLPLFGHGARV
jgi:hypothetical protein